MSCIVHNMNNHTILNIHPMLSTISNSKSESHFSSIIEDPITSNSKQQHKMELLNRDVQTNTSPDKMKDAFDLKNDSYIETPWDCIQSYFKYPLKQLVRHHIESYNYFIERQIEKTIQMFNPFKIHSKQTRYFPVKPLPEYVKNDDGSVEIIELDEVGMVEVSVVQPDGSIVPTIIEQPSDQTLITVHITFNNFAVHQPQIHENSGAMKVMLPNEARLRGFTYAASMTIDLNIQYIVLTGPNYETRQIHNVCLKKIHIGKMPIMVKSSACVLSQYNHVPSSELGECPHDIGGYFIIKGSEKIVISQKKIADNIIICNLVPKSWDLHGTYSWVAELRCVPNDLCISPKQVHLYYKRKENKRKGGSGIHGLPIHVKLPKTKTMIPLVIVFRALGVVSDKDICKLIVDDLDSPDAGDILNALKPSIVEANIYLTQEECITYITKRIQFTPMINNGVNGEKNRESGEILKREFAEDMINNDIFTHCKTLSEKQHYLGYMTRKLLDCVLGYREPDNRDSYMNTRIETTGVLLNTLLRNHFNKVVKEMEIQIVREINNGAWKSTYDYENIINMTNIYKILKPSTIENNIIRALSTGDFGVKGHNTNKAGVAQVLNRLTYVSSLSHARRVSNPNKSGKSTEPRKLNGTGYGYICPAETPEGAPVGLVQNLSYMAHITVHSDTDVLYKYVKGIIIPIETTHIHHKDDVKVFLNGCCLGITNDPQFVYNDLKDKKHKGIISIYTSIVFKCLAQEIWINNHSGRLMRPLLRVVDNNILLTKSVMKKIKMNELCWDDLLVAVKTQESIIEYVDAAEQNESVIANEPKDILDHRPNYYTHCEIHPSTMFGILASCIPFPDHNQSPRNTYQCAQVKQTIGISSTNFNDRMDKTAYMLNYPERPLVDTRTMNIINLNKLPSGINAIVAIMSYTGYNQEDSLLFNQGAVDRGLFSATLIHTETDDGVQKPNGLKEIRGRPIKGKTSGCKYGNYDKVNANGVIPENELIENRDVIIAKYVHLKENKNAPPKTIKYADMSRIYKTREETFVDKNYNNRNGDGYNFVKTRIRAMRLPNIGDKFSSRHGQKGTVGNVIPEEDMPYTADGVRPDIIINPHAIPSRMTIGHLKETLLGKVLIALGLFGDGTSYGKFGVNDISDELTKNGFHSKGEEIMYDGLTGEQLTSNIFIGPIFYQRLKHMVNDKTQSRATGPNVNLTRQPTEGRSRDGGLRIGEMERDCLISHGMSKFTRDRLFTSSDKYDVYVCKKCGSIAAYNDDAKFNIHNCRMCNNRTDFAHVEMPYACKLLTQELQTMNIAPRFITT